MQGVPPPVKHRALMARPQPLARSSATQQLGRSRRTTSCVASQRSSYFPCCFIHVVERSSRNTLTRDLVGSSSATCSSYESELNSVDCTPPGGCRTDILSKYAGPDMLSHGRQESPQPTHATAATHTHDGSHTATAAHGRSTGP